MNAILTNKTMHIYLHYKCLSSFNSMFFQMKIWWNMVMNVQISTSPSLGPYVGLKTQKLAKEIPPLVPIANPQLHYFTLGKFHIIFKLNTNQCYILSITRVVFFNCFSFWLSNITIHSLIYIYIYILPCNFLILNCRFIQCQSFLLEILLIYLNI